MAPGLGAGKAPLVLTHGVLGRLPAAASTARLACSHRLPWVVADPGRALTLSLRRNRRSISSHSGNSNSTEEVAKGHRANDSDQDFGQVTVAKDAREEATSFPCGFGGKSLASAVDCTPPDWHYDAGSQRQTLPEQIEEKPNKVFAPKAFTISTVYPNQPS